MEDRVFGTAQASAWGLDLLARLVDEIQSSTKRTDTCGLRARDEAFRLRDTLRQLEGFDSSSLPAQLAINEPCEIQFLEWAAKERRAKGPGMFVLVVIPKVGWTARFKAYTELRYLSAAFQQQPTEVELKAESLLLDHIIGFEADDIGNVATCVSPSVKECIEALESLDSGAGRLLLNQVCLMETRANAQVKYETYSGSFGGLVSYVLLNQANKSAKSPFLKPLRLKNEEMIVSWWTDLSPSERSRLCPWIDGSISIEELLGKMKHRQLGATEDDLFQKIEDARATFTSEELLKEEDMSDEKTKKKKSKQSAKRKLTEKRKQSQLTTPNIPALVALEEQVVVHPLVEQIVGLEVRTRRASSSEGSMGTLSEGGDELLDLEKNEKWEKQRSRRKRDPKRKSALSPETDSKGSSLSPMVTREVETVSSLTEVTLEPLAYPSSTSSVFTVTEGPESGISAVERVSSISEHHYAPEHPCPPEQSINAEARNDSILKENVVSRVDEIRSTGNSPKRAPVNQERVIESPVPLSNILSNEDVSSSMAKQNDAKQPTVSSNDDESNKVGQSNNRGTQTSNKSSDEMQSTAKRPHEAPTSPPSMLEKGSSRTPPKSRPDLSSATSSSNGSKSPARSPSRSGVVLVAAMTTSTIPTQSSFNPAYKLASSGGGEVSHSTLASLHTDLKEMAAALDLVATRRQPWQLAVAERVKQVVYSVWPRAWCDVFGSIANGLAAPCSDVDMVVRGVPQADRMRVLAHNLEKQEWVQMVQSVERTAVPVVKFNTAAIPIAFGNRGNLIAVDITFENEAHHGLNTCGLVRQFVHRWPPLKPLVLVLKQFLVEKGLNETYVGGLSSYGLVIMVAAIMKRHWPAGCTSEVLNQSPILGVLLVEFLEAYSSKEFVLNGVRLGPGPSRKLLGDPCYIEDPLDPNNNVGRACFGISQVVEVFSKALEAIRSYDATARTNLAHPYLTSVLGRVFATSHHRDVVHLVTKVWCPPELPPLARGDDITQRPRFFPPPPSPIAVASANNNVQGLGASSSALQSVLNGTNPAGQRLSALERWATEVKVVLTRSAKNAETNSSSGGLCQCCRQMLGPEHDPSKCELFILASNCPI